MTGAELVVLALIAAEETGQPALLAQRVEAVVAPGQNLPRIALMADVPDDLVARGLEGRAGARPSARPRRAPRRVATRLGRRRR